MSDDLTTVSSSELAQFTRSAMSKLLDPLSGLMPAEREALNLTRIGAVGELNKRAQEAEAAKAAARSHDGRIGLLNELQQRLAAETDDAMRASLQTHVDRLKGELSANDD